MLAMRRRQQVVAASVAEATMRGVEIRLKRCLGQLGAPLGGEQHVEQKESAMMMALGVKVRKPRRHVCGDREQTVLPRECDVTWVFQHRRERCSCQLGQQAHLAIRLVGNDGEDVQQ